MSKRILVICASPRKTSNSDELANAFIAGAVSAGHQVERIKLSEHEIKPCLGCDYCRAHDFVCVQKDYMQTAYNLVQQSDMIVFATPLYFLTFCAQLKTFIDRLYCLHHGKMIRDKESILLASCGSSNPAADDHLLLTYHATCNLLGWKAMGSLTARGYPHDGSIKNSEKIQEAYNLGVALAG